MDKLKNKIPQVRFPEFKEGWKFIHGNELFERISNKNHNSDLPILAISQEFGAIPRHLINYKISVTEKSVSSYKVVEKGDFIISLRSFQGGIEYSNYKGICSPAYIILRPTIELEADFYKSHFKSFRYIQQLQSKLEGIRDGKMISYKYFSEIKLPFPTLPEQKKIAHFFSIIDQKLTQLQEKKTALELYKKGMMQQLFCPHYDSDDLDDEQDFEKNSQEKNQGNQENQKKSKFRLRFKDDNGKDFPDWEEKKLGEILTKNSSTISANNIEQNFGDYIIYGASGVLKKIDFYKEENEYISIIKDGAGVGRVFLCKAKTSVLGTLDILKVKKDNLLFMFFFLETFNFLKYITGSTIPHIYFSDYKNAKIQLPSLKEQTKIANFLSKIDDKINTVTEKIDQTKAYKKGLLQKMFV